MDNYPFNIERWEHYKACQKKYIETGDCDPSYPVLKYLALKNKLDIEEKYWLAFIYSSCYNDATAWAMFKTLPKYTEITEQNLSLWWAKYKSRLDFTTDRAKVKNFNKVVPMFLSYKKLIGDNQEQKFKELSSYDNIYNYLGKIYYVGRFSLFLITEIIQILTDLSIEPTNLDLENADSSRNGLCFALGADNWVKTKLTKDQYIYLYKMLKKLLEETKIENPHLKITYWNIETSLCAYKKYYWKTRYIGFYLDRQLEGLKLAEQKFPKFQKDWNNIWEARNLFFDHTFLGELNDWRGIRKYMMGHSI